MYFMRVPEPGVGENRWHVDLVTPGAMSDEVNRFAALDAHLVEVCQVPDTLDDPDTWSVLEDPEGNVFCVTSEQAQTRWV